MTTPTRRKLFTAGASALAFASTFVRGLGLQHAEAAEATEKFEITRSKEEWKQILSNAQYSVLRLENTERPFTSPLNKEHRSGRYSCAGCALDLFSSTTKFDSGTGWPSFWKPFDNAVAERRDSSFGMARVEIHCRRCGGHLGHVFNDGPKPTGLRYCMNGAAMNFQPGKV